MYSKIRTFFLETSLMCYQTQYWLTLLNMHDSYDMIIVYEYCLDRAPKKRNRI